MAAQNDALVKKISSIVALANKDEKFRRNLLSNPHLMLQAQGLNIPQEKAIEVQYYAGYGLFMPIDAQLLNETVFVPISDKDELNDTHFSDCLNV